MGQPGTPYRRKSPSMHVPCLQKKAGYVRKGGANSQLTLAESYVHVQPRSENPGGAIKDGNDYKKDYEVSSRLKVKYQFEKI